MANETLTGTEIVTQDDNSLVQYGKMSDIKMMADRIKILMPGNQEYTHNEAFTLAQLAIAHDLDPFNGEVWLIKTTSGKVLGSLIGIKGLRKQAKKQAKYWGVGGDSGFTQILDEEEKKKLGAKVNDLVYVYTFADSVTQAEWIKGLRALIDVGYDQNDAHKMMGDQPTTRGIGIYTPGEQTKMNPIQAAMFRAEKDGLKRRFDVRFEIYDPTQGDGAEISPIIEAHNKSMPGSAYDKPTGSMMGFEVEGIDEPAEPSEPVEDAGFAEIKTLEEVLEPASGERIEGQFRDYDPVTGQTLGPLPLDSDTVKTEDDRIVPAEIITDEPPAQDVIDDGISLYDAKTGLRIDTTPPAETVVEVFEQEATEPEPKPKRKTAIDLAEANKNRPFAPQQLKDTLDEWASMYKAPCTDEHRKMLAAALNTVMDGEKTKRYLLCKGLTGASRTGDIPDAYVQAMLGTWLNVTNYSEPPTPVAIVEAKSFYRYFEKLTGQAEFDLGETPIEE